MTVFRLNSALKMFDGQALARPQRSLREMAANVIDKSMPVHSAVINQQHTSDITCIV